MRDKPVCERQTDLEQIVLEAPDVGAHRIKGCRELRAKSARHLVGKLEQVAFACEQVTFRHHLVEFSGGHTHRIGKDVERARQAIAELTTHFFRRELALRDNLLDGEERPFS